MSIKNNEQIKIAIKKVGVGNLVNIPINEFAKRVGISTSAISRYVRYNGYRDYKSFQLNLMKSEIIVDFAFNSDINKTGADVVSKKIQEISSDITEAKKVFIVGFGHSTFAATELNNNLVEVAKNSSVFSDFQKALFVIPTVTKNDVVIFFSERASSPEIIFLFERLRHTNCKIWLIGAAKEFTNTKNLVIEVEQRNPIRINAQESLIKQMNVANLIINYYVVTNKLQGYKIISQSLLHQWNNFKK